MLGRDFDYYHLVHLKRVELFSIPQPDIEITAKRRQTDRAKLCIEGYWGKKQDVVNRRPQIVQSSSGLIAIVVMTLFTIILYNKVITKMVIGPLDDHAYCSPSAFTHLRL